MNRRHLAVRCQLAVMHEICCGFVPVLDDSCSKHWKKENRLIFFLSKRKCPGAASAKPVHVLHLQPDICKYMCFVSASLDRTVEDSQNTMSHLLVLIRFQCMN